MNEIARLLHLPPKDFLEKIPKSPKENISFRIDLHGYLAEASKGARNAFIEICRECPSVTFNAMYWTFQPRKDILPQGVLPFITWEPWQDEAIYTLSHHMRVGGKIQAKKSREVGGTWIILGCGYNEWLTSPMNVGLVTSRKEELVDKKGNPVALFWKLDFLHNHLPEWARPDIIRTDRHLENKWNGSVISGETTTVDAGRGDRRDWAFCDEFPAVNHTEAEGIDRSLTDTAACRVFLGTSIYRSHPFSKMGRQKNTVKMAFGWWLHPFKARGLYYSPDLNRIVIKNIKYYKDKWPLVFDKYESGKELVYSDLQKEMFMSYPDGDFHMTADGGDPNKPKWRSPWYDNTCLERTDVDIATNLDMNEIGAGDMVFNPITLSQMTSEYVRKPDLVGEITYNQTDDRISKVKFLESHRGKFSWWGKMGGSRPVQNHNYVMGCDISLGQGQSNSTCTIFDVDTRTKVGRWVDASTMPETFAEQVYAIGQWVGGMTQVPLLNFEANGIGQVFGKRIRELGYPFVFKTTTEKKGRHERKTTVGWHSSAAAKLELLTNYNAALSACFSRSKKRKFINPDADAINEAEDYIFHGTQLIPSSSIEEVGGAKAAHGDIVIADALANLAAADQMKAAVKFEELRPGTFAYRRRKLEERKRNQRTKTKLWLDV